MVAELQRRRDEAHGKPVDVLNLFRALAMDTTTVYLMGESFNSVGRQRLSATDFVDSFVAGGRFFYLPAWLFNPVDHWAAKLDKDKNKIAASSAIVEEFAAHVVDRSIADEKDDKTYQGRLLRAGISREVTIAQIVDVMFAGTDAAAMTMSMLCCYLGQPPQKYERVRKEVLDNPDTDAQSLSYLSGVVKEALRLALANPTRLPRIVPPEGLHVPGLPAIPGGTSVGLGAFMLHHNPDVFPDSHKFLPERWPEATPEMVRDSFYFGHGSRQCIARNFAAAGLWWATEALIRSDVLRGARPIKDKIEVLEWFNARVIDGKIEMRWE